MHEDAFFYFSSTIDIGVWSNATSLQTVIILVLNNQQQLKLNGQPFTAWDVNFEEKQFQLFPVIHLCQYF